MIRSRLFVAVLGLLTLGSLTAVNPANAQSKTLDKVMTITLPNTSGGGDYMSIADGFLYVANTQQGTMSIVDLRTNSVTANIPGVSGVHGFATVPGGHKGYITSGSDNSVVVYDLDKRREIRRIPVGQGPDAITYASKSGLIYVANHKGRTATLINPKSDFVVGTILLNGTAEYAREDPSTGLVYQNLEDTNEVVVVDPKSMRVTHRYPTKPGEGPTGLAFDPKNSHLFSACGNKTLVVMNASDGKIVQSLPIGEDVDFAEFDPMTGRIYTANGGGSVTVIQQTGDKYAVTEDVPTVKGAHTLALDPATHRIYVLHQSVIDVYQGH